MSSITVSNPTRDDPNSGYFRIGNVVLQIPPEDIQISRVSNAEELTVLRAKFPYIHETGQSRWDVSLSWTALYNSEALNVWSQWEDVRTIVAMMKSAPFVEVENELLRSVISSTNAELSFSNGEIDGDKGYFRLAFALRQLKVTTTEDIVDGVRCQLVMTLFNYLPFTKDFSYIDSKGQAVDASLSTPFTTYLNAWKAKNLDTPQDGSFTPWTEQDDTETTFSWRTYMQQPGKPPAAPADLDTELWKVDYATDTSTFRYMENEFTLDSSGGDSNDFGLFPNNFSVVFVNQFAQLPLASYQYPSYQHTGPGTTMIGISFESDGPDSSGVGQISSMITQLKKQYLQYRHAWKSTASVYRMQAILVRNQFLNMLGIWGLSATDFSVSTTTNAAGKLMCTLMARQYENYYEMLTGYKVYGNSHYLEQLYNFIKSDDFLKNLTDDEKSAVSVIIKFKEAWNKHDDTYLSNFLLASDPKTAKTLETLPAVPLPDNLRISLSDQKTLFTTLLEPPAWGASATKLTILSASTSSLKDLYPWLWARQSDSHVMTYTEYWVLTRLNTRYMKNYDSVQVIKKKIDSQVPTIITEQLWEKAFEYLGVSNPTAQNQLDQIVRSKSFQDTVGTNQALYGPGSDIYNKDHGCYRDLGLDKSNPDQYFYDYSKDISIKVGEEMEKSLAGAMTGFSAFNNKGAQTKGTTPVSLSDFGIQNGDPSGMMMRSNIPRFNMSSCFPTYKLFLIEDDNSGVFYCYDDFYSYSSVTEIELIKYRDKPDTAIIQITNMAGLLTHKLYNNTVEGRREWEISNDQRMDQGPDGQQMQGHEGVNSAILAWNLWGRNYTKGSGSVNTPGEPYAEDEKNVPLKYYALQTGSKIQIRLGYDNNPDSLYPVFVGQITQMDEQDGIITLVAQSYLTELNTIIPDEVSSNGFSVTGLVGEMLRHFTNVGLELASGSPGNSIAEFLRIFKFWKRAPAYGGLCLFSERGDASSVIKSMLKTSQSKHFGHWQISAIPDNYVKGFTWASQAGLIIGNNAVGNALRNSYDRSPENIMVNQLVNYNGEQSNGKFPMSRSWDFEAPICLPASYSIKDPLKNPPWFYMTDVGRRYPEYVLSAKHYGFPYQADATMVFAHPNDFYYSRSLLLGEVGADKHQPAAAKGPFVDWWYNKNGRARTAKMLYSYRSHLFSDSNIEEVMLAIDTSLDPNVYNQQLDNVSTELNSFWADPVGHFDPNIADKKVKDFKVMVNGLRNELNYYLKAKLTGSLGHVDGSNRIQPVRRWHYVDHDTIIHNGIKLNDKFYNTVKLSDEVHCINEMIPSHHRRVLNVDEMVESPDDNVKGAGNQTVRVSVIQSFLREECGKMYQGELMIRGTPEIEPWDMVLITDPSTGMTGPVEVDSVIHTFNQEMGFVTIIKPRALVIVNEAASMGLIRSYYWAVANSKSTVLGYASTYSTSVAAVAVGSASVLTAAAVGYATLAVFGGPVGWTIIGLISAKAICSAINISKGMNVSMVFPLMRYGNPWIGGLEGYRAGDLMFWMADKWHQFTTDEVYPIIESWNTVAQGISPSLRDPSQPPPDPSSLATLHRNAGGKAAPGAKAKPAALDAFAAAIQKFEGGHPKDKNMRNNNPGNLRTKGTANPSRDGGGFAIFNSYQEGLEALKRDISAKMTGNTHTGLGPNSTIREFFYIYAPPGDSNPTEKYAQTVAKAVGMTADAKLGTLLSS